MKKKPKIFFVIHPSYQDFNILAIGDKKLLKKLAMKDKYSHYIKSFQLVVIDTCDRVSDAVKIVREYQRLRI